MEEVETIEAVIARLVSQLKSLKPDAVRGRCGELSIFLGKLLSKAGVSNVCLVSSARRIDDHDANPQSHAWLYVQGLVVDVTIQQFDEFEEPFVGRASVWHNGWENPVYETIESLCQSSVNKKP